MSSQRLKSNPPVGTESDVAFDPPFAAGPTWSAESLGASLEDVGSDRFDGEDGPVLASWHRSNLGAELIVWRSESGALLQAQIDVRGEIAQWNSKLGFRTGFIVEDDAGLGGAQETVRFDTEIVPAARDRAVAILREAASLVETERTELMAAFSNGVVQPLPPVAPEAPLARSLPGPPTGSEGVLSGLKRLFTRRRT